MKRILLSCLLLAATWSSAAGPVADLLPGLASSNIAERGQAMATLQKLSAQAGRPDAESERQAVCREIAAQLTADCPVAVATPLVRQLRFIGGEESVPALAALLQHTDARLRDDARQALESNPSPLAQQALLAALASPRSPADLVGALSSLGRRKAAGSSAAIVPLLASPDPLVAAAAQRALVDIADEAAIAALVKAHAVDALFNTAQSALARGDRKTAAAIYGTLLTPAESEAVRAAALGGLAAADAKRALPLINEALRGESEALRVAAITAAARSGDTDLMKPVAAALPSLADPLKVQALSALALRRDRSLAPSIAPLLTATNAEVAQAAVRALASTGDAASLPALLAAAGRSELKKEVATTLEELDAPGVDDQLILLLSSPSPEQRTLALDALLARQAPGLQQHLLRMARDSDAKIAGAALTALRRVAGPAEFDDVLAIVKAAPSRAIAESGLGVLMAIAAQSPDPAAQIARIGSQMAAASPDSKRALLSAMSKFGMGAPPAQALAALHTMAPLLEDPALAATAAHFSSELAARVLAADPVATEKVLTRMKALTLPDDLRRKIDAITGLDDGWLVNGLVAGPYEGGEIFAKPYAPETAGAEPAWRLLTEGDRNEANNRIVDLGRTLAGDNRVAYLRFAIIQPAAGRARLEVGSDDGVRVWLNGKLVHEKDLVRPCKPGEDAVDVALEKGANTLLVKVVQRAGHWQFAGRVVPTPTP